MSAATCPFPSHVPHHLVRELDPYNLDGAKEDAISAWAKVQKESPDVFFMPNYGGYWVLTRKELIDQVFTDPAVFSSVRAAVFPELPPETPLFQPLQSDPPDHHYFRQPFNILLSPPRVKALVGIPVDRDHPFRFVVTGDSGLS
jgi:cytochrome P450